MISWEILVKCFQDSVIYTSKSPSPRASRKPTIYRQLVRSDGNNLDLPRVTEDRAVSDGDSGWTASEWNCIAGRPAGVHRDWEKYAEWENPVHLAARSVSVVKTERRGGNLVFASEGFSKATLFCF